MPAEAEADLGGLGRVSGLDELLLPLLLTLPPPRLVPPWPRPVARGVFRADIARPAVATGVPGGVVDFFGFFPAGVVFVAVAVGAIGSWDRGGGRAEVGDDDEDDEEEDEDGEDERFEGLLLPPLEG